MVAVSDQPIALSSLCFLAEPHLAILALQEMAAVARRAVVVLLSTAVRWWVKSMSSLSQPHPDEWVKYGE